MLKNLKYIMEMMLFRYVTRKNQISQMRKRVISVKVPTHYNLINLEQIIELLKPARMIYFQIAPTPVSAPMPRKSAPH